MRSSCHSPLISVLLLATAALASPAVASDGKQVDFAKDVYPIFQRHCIECHGEETQEGQLRLDARAPFLQGGTSGRTVVPGEPDRSTLWLRLIDEDPERRMPQDTDPLSSKQRQVIRRWILDGASWPEDVGPRVELKPHWAYQPIQRPSIPSAGAGWARTPIDNFVARRLAEQQLSVSPPAAKAVWIRRVYLDLIGIPPSPQEVDAFLADHRPGAEERVVDRLLASPRYGEHWARQWLDLARYADSNGYQADQYRSVWPYRDWVIRAINADMPFDQFTIWQLAGDLLPEPTVDQRIATGFARLTTCNVEAGVDPEENRVEQVVDRVNTVSTVWLGTTMGCAQCHEHKYDPFTMRDYYQLFAYFNNTPIEVSGNGVTYNFIGPWMDLPQDEAIQAQRKEWEAERQRLTRQKEQLRKRHLTRLPQWIARQSAAIKSQDPHAASSKKKKQRTSLPKNIADILRLPKEKWTKAQRRSVEDYFVSQQGDVQEVTRQLTEIQKKLDATKPVQTLVMIELDQPRETHVLLRGDYHTPGERVHAGTPEHLPQLEGLPANRLGLAEWLVDARNPLTARVVVNRWWYHFWGRGIVNTLEDFGTRGDRPTHPELLDWLASELIRSGWSRKHVHRLIVLSAAYRQSSVVTSEQLARDPHNQWYARGPRVRLQAEEVRDHMLAAAGLLSDRMFGPPVYPPQPPGIWRHVGRNAPVYRTSQAADRFRRGIYVIWRRSAPYPSFVNFDAPDRASCVVKRPVSNTPLQALTLMNDVAYAEAAMGLVERVLRNLPEAEDRERLTYAFRCCVARLPTPDELEELLHVLNEERKLARADLNKSRQRIARLQSAVLHRPAKLTERGIVDRAAWWMVANVLMNLDEAVTKE